MAITEFEAFVLDVKSIKKDDFTTEKVFASYVLWLIHKNEKEAPVNELLFQLKIIAAYVEYTLKQIENLNADTITVNPIPERINNDTLSHTAIEQALMSHFKTSNIEAYNAIHNASTTYFKQKYNYQLSLFAVASAILIGAAFAPELATAGAITLWTLGAVSGAVTLLLAGIRYASDTSRPEIALGGNNNFLGHDEKYLKAKRRHLNSAVSRFVDNDSNKPYYNKNSPIFKTSADIADIFKVSDRTALAIQAIIDEATTERYAPMYQSSTAPVIARDDVRPDQKVHLGKLSPLLPR